MMMYSLAVIYGISCMPSLSSLLISVGALFILMHTAIQVVYCHYMLTPFVECLWYVKIFKTGVLATGQHAPSFLELLLFTICPRMSVCVYVFACESAPKAINN